MCIATLVKGWRGRWDKTIFLIDGARVTQKMLVTFSRWLVIFDLDCERCSDPDGLKEGEESAYVEVEALRGRESRPERVGWLQVGAPMREMFPLC